jgi:16S rRNA (uracil1498-N3)-methyltransferase
VSDALERTSDTLRRAKAHVFVADLDALVLDRDDAHHLGRVLRMRDGETVTASDGAGRWRTCEWQGGHLVATGDVTLDPRPAPRVTVAIAPLKGDRTDWTVEKLVEIGVARIVVLAPLVRSVVRRDAGKDSVALARWQRLARAAAMQSRRTHLPEVSGPVALGDVAGLTGAGIAEPGGEARPEDVEVLLIGPEGGFDPSEVALAREVGARTVDLGPGILRAETAALVGATRMVAHTTR